MLNEELREELKQILAEIRMDSMFDNYGKEEIVYEGLSTTGLNHMTDQQLVDEYKELMDDGHDEDEFLIKLKIEMESHKLLTPE